MTTVLPLLAGCAPGLDLPPTDPCPPVDWVVPAQDYVNDTIDRVWALPGGDTLVTGRAGRVQIGTGPEDIVPNNRLNGRVVARLGPDGRARWMHSAGSGSFSRYLPGLGPDAVWIVGEQANGSFTLDGAPLAGSLSDWDGFALEFALEDGALRRSIFVGGPSPHSIRAAAADDAGNVYLTGTYSDGGLDLGEGLRLDGPPDDGGTSEVWPFLASWDRAGRPRWLVGISGYGEGAGVAWVDGSLLWLVHGGEYGGVVYPDGTRGSPARSTAPDVVFPVDPDTGRVDDSRMRLSAQTLNVKEFGDLAPGGVAATGWMQSPARWTDADGVEHVLQQEGQTVLTADLTLDPTGRVVGGSVNPTQDVWGGDVAHRLFAGQFYAAREVGPLTVDDFGGYTSLGSLGVVGWTDEEGAIACAWEVAGTGHGSVYDVALDELGGIVAVGSIEYYGPTSIRALGGEVLYDFPAGDGTPDGFIVRFASPLTRRRVTQSAQRRSEGGARRGPTAMSVHINTPCDTS